MKLFSFLLGAACALVVKSIVDGVPAEGAAAPRRFPKNGPAVGRTAEEEIAGPVSEV